MGLYDLNVATSRRTMVIYFIIDTSGSMEGAKIGQVNSAIEGTLKEIKKMSEKNADAEIKVCVLDFSTKAVWITPEPVSVEEKGYKWDYVEAGGLTALGEACKELNTALSTQKFMNEAAGSYAPVLFLLSDGEPTDDYKRGIEVLKHNNWFKAAIKVAIGIGKDANTGMLEEFTGSSESVVTTHTPEELKKWIQFIAVTSTQIGSQASDTTGKNKDAQVKKEIDEQKNKNSENKDSDYLGW